MIDPFFVLTAIGLTITIGIFILTQIKQNRIHSNTLLNDLFRQENEHWKYIQHELKYHRKDMKQLPPSTKSFIFNYYEFLAYLIIKGRINKKDAYNLWSKNIKDLHEYLPEAFADDREYLRELYEKWKNRTD